MKNVSKLMMMIALITIMASCKKSNNDVVEPNTPVTTSDLLNQYITLQASVTPSLRILYFTKDGNDVKATVDAVTSRRAQTVTIADNSFTFDTDGDGKKVYTFTFSKDGSGKLSMDSYTYKNADVPEATAVYAQLNSITDAQDPKSKRFLGVEHVGYSMNFTDLSTWLVIDQRGSDTAYPSYYLVSPGAWKGTRPDGTAYMGVSVPKWNGTNQPVILVQSSAANSTIEVYKQAN
ncbi:MAG: hypothetical protein V4456_12960 [Bacteroidota bacterium]